MNTEDRELLELAAKAAGIEHPGGDHCAYQIALWDCKRMRWWRPLSDDGDAMRLAVRLGFIVDTHGAHTRISFPFDDPMGHEPHGENPDTATRRAIVRAAAEIGRRMA